MKFAAIIAACAACGAGERPRAVPDRTLVYYEIRRDSKNGDLRSSYELSLTSTRAQLVLRVERREKGRWTNDGVSTYVGAASVGETTLLLDLYQAEEKVRLTMTCMRKRPLVHERGAELHVRCDEVHGNHNDGWTGNQQIIEVWGCTRPTLSSYGEPGFGVPFLLGGEPMFSLRPGLERVSTTCCSLRGDTCDSYGGGLRVGD